MSEEEHRFSVMLTRSEVETIASALEFEGSQGHHNLIDRLERRLRQRDTHDAQELRLADDPEILVGI